MHFCLDLLGFLFENLNRSQIVASSYSIVLVASRRLVELVTSDLRRGYPRVFLHAR